jgi:type I restriction enzyme S subunit
MNETLEAIARAIFKSWFVDFDPVKAKMSGEPYPLPDAVMALFPDELVESELGMIPKGWEIGKLGDEFKVVMGQSPPGSSYNEEGKGIAFYQGRTDFGFRYPSERVYCTEPKRFAEPGDTLVSVRAPVGDVNMAKEKCCIGRGVAAIRHKSDSSSYTYYSMLDLQRRFKVFEAEGTVFGSIGKRDFNNLLILFPNKIILTFFNHFVSSIDKKIENNFFETNDSKELKNELTNYFFN